MNRGNGVAPRDSSFTGNYRAQKDPPLACALRARTEKPRLAKTPASWWGPFELRSATMMAAGKPTITKSLLGNGELQRAANLRWAVLR